MATRLSRQQEQENVSRKQLAEFLETHGFVTADVNPDLGEDLLVRIYDQGVSTGLSFYVQLKSVDDIDKHILKTGEISFSLEVKDLQHWAAQAVAVVLVIWDVKRKQGWWIWINEAIKPLQARGDAWKRNATARVRVPKDNQLDEAALHHIRLVLANLYYSVIAKDKEVTVQAKFSFPPTPEGRAKLEEFKRHIAAGDEVELDGKYIEAFDFPDWWQRLYGQLSPGAMHLKIAPARSDKAIPTRIRVRLRN